MTQRLQRVVLKPQDAELARRFYRLCCERFGNGCVAVVRKRKEER